MREPVRFVFRGDLESESFAEFAQHRARRLDIGLHIKARSKEEYVMDVDGADDLVDAFEMACSLGPQNCIIMDVFRTGGDVILPDDVTLPTRGKNFR